MTTKKIRIDIEKNIKELFKYSILLIIFSIFTIYVTGVFKYVTLIFLIYYAYSTVNSMYNIVKLNKLLEKQKQREYEDDMKEFERIFQEYMNKFHNMEQEHYERMRRKFSDTYAGYKSYDYYGNKYTNTKTNYISVDVYNAFKLLKLSQDSNIEQIKKKYRELVMKHHPDKYDNNPDNHKIATRNLQKLNNAYSVLKKHKNFN